MAEESLISRAAAAIAEVMGANETADRDALARLIARTLHARGLLRDPDDKIPVYRGQG